MRLKLVVQYDGLGLHGWQAQEGLPTVQGLMAEALAKVVEHEVDIIGAGRTDAGVHAWGQVCHVDVDKPLKIERYLTGMNHFLPDTVRVIGVEAAGEDFHARYSALARHYVYRLYNARWMRPDLAGHAGHVPVPLDMDAIAAAVAAMPLGEQDFSGFRDAECQSRTPVCNLHYVKWVVEGGGVWRLEVGADHFLHHMVRNIMGTLVEIGLGKRGAGGLVEVLEGRDRTKAGITFMPDGLYLSRVDY